MSNDVETTETADAEQTVRIPASTRRAVLSGAGAVGAAVVLTACGTDTAEPTTPAPAGNAPGAAQTGAAQPGTAQSGGATADALATKAQVPVGGGYINAAEKVVVTQPTAGSFKAFSAVCTHKQCLVTAVTNGTITCKCHNSEFSVEDGSVKGGPATEPLAEKSVKADGDNIVAA